eukprot:1470078-Pyramimonas_sp.AAC.1
MWSCPRVIRLGRHRAQTALVATHGLPAGDGYSDLAIKVNAVDAFDTFVELAPFVDFQNYIDDTGLH